MLIETDNIIKAILEGKNTEVLNQLYKKVLPGVESYIRKNSGNRAEAEDIFQDAVLILFSQIKQNKFNDTYRVDSFLFSVCRNLWINRAKKRNRNVELNGELVLEEEFNFVDNMVSEEKVSGVRKVLEQLGSPCKELLKYQVYEKMSMEEITKKMGLANGNVARVYNHRCKQKFLKIIEKDGNLLSLFKS